MQVSLYLQNFYGNQQVQKSVDNQFKKAIEQYRDDPDLQNAIDAVQEGVSKGIIFSVVHITNVCRVRHELWKMKGQAEVLGKNSKHLHP